jgi:thioredoxin reductase (NADPH)
MILSLPNRYSIVARQDEWLDCVIIGGGAAGLTAALYLARFNRSFLLVDGEASRAQWIPASHNIPFFANGVAGPEILALQRTHLARYGVGPSVGNVTRISTRGDGLGVEVKLAHEKSKLLAARRVLLATGSVDIEPDLPGLPNAIQRGLVRFCPICDGFEAAGKRNAVLGYGWNGIGEAIFIARTCSRHVTLLTLGQTMKLEPTDRASPVNMRKKRHVGSKASNQTSDAGSRRPRNASFIAEVGQR